MEFIKYQRLERFGTTEVNGIEHGTVYVFPKVDGTNASVWLDKDGNIQAGSRNRHLSLEKDNAGFLEWVLKQENLLSYLKANPTHRLFGEWLVPHTLKTYREDAWRNFYVFDVAVDNDNCNITDELRYIGYDVYQSLLEEHGVSYIAPISIITNTNYEQLIRQLDKNVFLIKDGHGIGEGIVIKNYDFVNKYGRCKFAKIVTSEFKELNQKVMGPHMMKGPSTVEQEIADKYVTTALVEKVFAKIEVATGFSSKNIPDLLNNVFYDIINEESWNFVSEHKNPVIDFRLLKSLVVIKIKSIMPHLF